MNIISYWFHFHFNRREGSRNRRLPTELKIRFNKTDTSRQLLLENEQTVFVFSLPSSFFCSKCVSHRFFTRHRCKCSVRIAPTSLCYGAIPCVMHSSNLYNKLKWRLKLWGLSPSVTIDWPPKPNTWSSIVSLVRTWRSVSHKTYRNVFQATYRNVFQASYRNVAHKTWRNVTHRGFCERDTIFIINIVYLHTSYQWCCIRLASIWCGAISCQTRRLERANTII